MSSPSEPKSGSRRPLIGRFLKWVLGGVAGVVVLAALLVGLFRVAANLVPRYHDRIEQEVSARLGVPVDIGTISLRWRGLGPALRFSDVRVLDTAHKSTVLEMSRLRLDFTLLALLHGTGARPSAIAVRGLKATLVEGPGGGFRIPGLALSGNRTGGSGLAAMLGDRLSVTRSSFSLVLAGSPRAFWTFDPVTLRIGAGKHHGLSLSVALPRTLGGGNLRAAGTLDTPSADVTAWRWAGRCSLDRLRLAPLGRLLPAGVPPLAGTADFESTTGGLGVSRGTIDGRLVATDLAAGGSRIQHFTTQFTLKMDGGYALTLEHPQLLQAGSRWSPGTVGIGRNPDGRLHAQVARLPLARLPALGGFFPSSLVAVANRLEAMRPVGDVEGLSLAWTPGKPDVDLDATLKDVSVQPADHVLGFRHFSATVAITKGVGNVAVDAPDFTLLMPYIFDHPVELDRVAGNVGVAWNAAGLALSTQRLAVSGPADLDGALEGEIHVPHSGPVTMRLSARGGPMAVDAGRQDYLPTGLIPKELTRWLMTGLRGGKVTGASLAIEGDLRKFPFAKGGGHFAIDLGFEGVELTPGERWTPLENLVGTVHFLNAGLSADITRGTVSGAQVTTATASIANFFKPRLHVKAEIAGDASDFLSFLRGSPVAGALTAGVADLHASGRAASTLDLDLPVMHPADFTLSGQLRLSGATALYSNVPYALHGLDGRVSFDGKGPTSGRLEGTLLKTPVTLTLAREGSPAKMRLTLDGRFPVAALSSAAHRDLGRYLAGTLPLHAELSVPLARSGAPVTTAIYSRLDGLAVDLPAPMGKSAGATVPLVAEGVVTGGRAQVTAHYGDALSGCASLALGAPGFSVRSAKLVLGDQACIPPVSGIVVSGGWPSLTLKPWLAMLPGGGATTLAAPPAMTIDLHFARLDLFGQLFRNQSIKGIAGKDGITLRFNGPDLAGDLKAPRRPSNEHPIVVELTRGHFALSGQNAVVVASASAAAAASGPAAAKTQTAVTRVAPAPAATAERIAAAPQTAEKGGLRPQDVPPFRLHAARLELGTASLENVEIAVKRVPGGLLVDPIHVGGGALTMDGKLVWVEPERSEAQGALHFVAHVDGLGKLLTGLGLGPVITGNGSLSAGLAWHTFGSQHFTNDLLGRISVDLRNGSISQVNPGAGRLLSLLAIANIPRYLVFNFRNLFGKGFPFSRIHGDYAINRGVAHTDGLYIDSSVADIKLTGAIDLGQETIDQKADIVPNYTGSLPIITALFGGLGVGAAVFALTKILGNPIAQMTKLEYSISGPLKNPLIKPIGHTPPPKAGTRPAAAAGGGR